jgi:DNA-binding GntR family transcriptional regulator
MATAEGFVVNQTRISEQIYSFLRDEIVSGRLAPGERLNLDELTERLKVSRMPIKEAVERLAGEGLLEVQARRGTFVSRLDPVELIEIFEVRCALEVLAGRKAVERVTKADIEKLRALIAAMEQTAGKADVRTHLNQNAEFHELIIALAGNRKLLETYRRLRTPIHVAGIHYHTDNWVDRVAQEQREHRAVVRALEQRDAEAVERALTQHITRASRSLAEDVERSVK